MTTVAVVNVRMGSTRLPGKALMSVAGKPLLGWLVERLRRAVKLDNIVIATSTLPGNDSIADFCSDHKIACVRGSEDDVLLRTLTALRSAGADVGVVVFGDGPLVDPVIVDEMVGEFQRRRPPVEFLSNDLTTTYPPGMEVEVFAVAALADAERRCQDLAVREHGTLFIRQHPELYTIVNVDAPEAFHRPDLELEVDCEQDLQVISALLRHFGARNDFGLREIIEFLDRHPEIASANRTVARRWKEFRN